MAIKLIKLTKKYQNQLIEMLDEWKRDQEENHTDTSPYAIFKNSYEDFDYYLDNLECDKHKNGWVPDSVFFLYSEARDKLLGAVNIRHTLNDHLLKCGGHIGDGIRPSERGKGFGKLIIELALKECIKLGINNVLIVCNKNNIASKRAILANGGVLENTVIDEEDGEVIERYWINAPRQLLLKYFDLIHLTPLSAKRIKKNLGLYEHEVLSEIEDAICHNYRFTTITPKGKNYYLRYRDIEYTINASSYTVITAKVIKPVM